MEDNIKIPGHIAFIMDGNGRWAKARHLPRKLGHKQGVVALENVVNACNDLGVKVVSFFAFSTENWSRPQEEIDAIFDLVEKFAKKLEIYIQKNLRVRFMGDLSPLPERTKEILNDIQLRAKDNTGMVVNIALNYGGRQEIVRACNLALQSGLMQVTEDDIKNCMYNPDLSDPDLIVRSSGEERLSNFYLWGAAYSEFVFVDDLWPDFDKNTIDKIIKEYSKRNRRFGKV